MTPDERNLLTPGEIADLTVLRQRGNADDLMVLTAASTLRERPRPWLQALNAPMLDDERGLRGWLNTPLTNEERAR